MIMDRKDTTFLMSEPMQRGETYNQWLELYHFVAANSVVHLSPTYYGYGFAVGMWCVSIPDEHENTLLVDAEEIHNYAKMMGIKALKPKFGIGDDCHVNVVKEDLLVVQSTKQNINWLQDTFDINVVKVKKVDKNNIYLNLNDYFFPLAVDKAMVCTKLITEKSLKRLEKHLDIIDVSYPEAESSICNLVRLGSSILAHSNISELKVTDEEYDQERKKVDTLTKICANNAFEPVLFDLSAVTRSTSDLMVRLTYGNYQAPKM